MTIRVQHIAHGDDLGVVDRKDLYANWVRGEVGAHYLNPRVEVSAGLVTTVGED
jgi:hypothetical protein